MQTVRITRDPHAMWRQITIACGGILLVAVVAQILLTVMFHATPTFRILVNIVLWFGALAFCFAVVYSRRASWGGEYYELTDNSIIVHKSSLTLGATESSYQYDAVSGVDVQQNRSGVKYDTGDILLTVVAIEGGVRLRDVVGPSDIARDIQRRITNSKSYQR